MQALPQLPQTPLQETPPVVPPSHPSKKRIRNEIAMGLLLIVLLAASAFTYFYYITYTHLNDELDQLTSGKTPHILPEPPPLSKVKTCTQEAKQCPDGSYVMRTGPNCEFSSCPTP